MIPGGMLLVGQESGDFDAFTGIIYDDHAGIGVMDSLRMWTVALDAESIKFIMLQPLYRSSDVLLLATFDADANMTTVNPHNGSLTRIASICDDVTGICLYGGCASCHDVSMWPVLQSSTAPVASTNSSAVATVPLLGPSNDSTVVLVPVLVNLLWACSDNSAVAPLLSAATVSVTMNAIATTSLVTLSLDGVRLVVGSARTVASPEWLWQSFNNSCVAFTYAALELNISHATAAHDDSDPLALIEYTAHVTMAAMTTATAASLTVYKQQSPQFQATVNPSIAAGKFVFVEPHIYAEGRLNGVCF